MALNLLDAAKSLLSKDLISKVASSLGESEGNIQKAFNGAIPSVLAGLINKSPGTGADKILDLAKAVAGSDILNNLTGFFEGNRSPLSGGSVGTGAMVSGWLRAVFADKINNIINAISGFAGIKLSSANAILYMAAPIALVPAGNYTVENNLTSSDLGSFLQSQKSSILKAIPAGFNLTGALGINSLEDIGGKATEAVSFAAEYAGTRAKSVSSGNKWLWALLFLAAIAALIWFFIM